MCFDIQNKEQGDCYAQILELIIFKAYFLTPKTHKMKKLLISLIGLILFSSFQQTDEIKWKEYKYPRYKMSVKVPLSFKVDENLEGENLKSISFSEPNQKINMTLFIDNKKDVQRTLEDNHLENKYSNNLNFYTLLRFSGFNKEFTVSDQSKPTEATVNGMRAIMVTLKASMLGPKEFYTMAFIEGKDRYYNLMISVPNDKIITYDKTIKYIIYSLKEQAGQNSYSNTGKNRTTSQSGVNKYTVSGGGRTEMYVKKGEKISIKASGRVTLGVFAGSGGPRGIQGFEIYSIVRDYPHGSLIAKIGDNGPWYYIGNGKTITADNSGYLKLYVNDVDSKNNSGGFAVECKKLNENYDLDKLPSISQIVNILDLLVKNDTSTVLAKFSKHEVIDSNDRSFIYDFYDQNPDEILISLTGFKLSYTKTDNVMIIILSGQFAKEEVYNFYFGRLQNEAVERKRSYIGKDGFNYQSFSLSQSNLTISNKGDKIVIYAVPKE